METLQNTHSSLLASVSGCDIRNQQLASALQNNSFEVIKVIYVLLQYHCLYFCQITFISIYVTEESSWLFFQYPDSSGFCFTLCSHCFHISAFFGWLLL